MAKRRGAASYTGILATPIPAGLGTRAHRKAVEAKLNALCRHYDISGSGDERLAELAVALVFAHVPGFQEARKNVGGAGKTFRWRDDVLLFLFLHVENEMLKRQAAGDPLQVGDAVLWVGADFRRVFPRKGKPISDNALRKGYYSARKRWGSGVDGILRAVREVRRPKGALEELD